MSEGLPKIGRPSRSTARLPAGLYTLLEGTWKKVLSDAPRSAESRSFRGLRRETKEKFWHDLALVTVWPKNHAPYFPGRRSFSRKLYERQLARGIELAARYPEMTIRTLKAFRARVDKLNEGPPDFWSAASGYFSGPDGTVVRDLGSLSPAAIRGLHLLRRRNCKK